MVPSSSISTGSGDLAKPWRTAVGSSWSGSGRGLRSVVSGSIGMRATSVGSSSSKNVAGAGGRRSREGGGSVPAFCVGGYGIVAACVSSGAAE